MKEVSKQSTLFRFEADRLPVILFTGMFFIDILVLFSGLPNTVVFIFAVLYFFPKSMLTAWNHHHQHVPTFKNKTLNMLLEVMYSFQTGVLPNGWVLHHNLGHHVNYMKGSLDESAWLTRDGKQLSEMWYTLKVGLLAYPLIVRNALRFDKKHGMRFMLGFLLCGAVFYGFWMVDPIKSVILFLMPAVAGLFGTVWFTYKHHAGLDTDVAEEASWNVLDPLYNKLTGNLGYHTAHHISCGVHWSKLPSLHEKIKHKIPAQLYRDPGFPFPLFSAVSSIFGGKVLSNSKS